MTERNGSSREKEATVRNVVPREIQEIRRCLEEILIITEEAENTQGAGLSGKKRAASFSVSEFCLETAGSLTREGENPLPGITIEIDPSVPPLVEGDSFRLAVKLKEILGIAASGGGKGITLSAVARRNLPGGIEILFSAGGGEKAASFSMAFSDAPLDENPRTPEAEPLALLAEDNPLSARILAANLEDLGFRVMTASTGREALALSGKHRFDIVFLDIQMPELDGVETSRALRKMEQKTGRKIPVLAVSASGDEEDRKRCLEAGMDGFLPKSSSPAALAQAISSFLPGREFLTHGETAEKSPLLSATGGNREAAAEAAAIFLKTAPPLMAEMKRAVAHENLLLLASDAHRLKGSLVFFGAEKAAGLAKTIEETAKNGIHDILPSLLYSLISEVSSLLAEIRKEWPPASGV